MHIVVMGVNHRSAPLELRERLAFRPEQLPAAFQRLREEVGAEETAILSTCNRVEIYARVPAWEPTISRLQAFLSAHSGVGVAGLASRLYAVGQPTSIRHLFAVASGLDSMVLGESEIQQQVRQAYEQARAHGAAGKVFNVLFQKALNAAKAVRHETGIGRGGLSIGSVAVEFAEKIFGRLAGQTVVLLGAGKIGELTLHRLAERGVTRLRVMNRSVERAASLAGACGAAALGLEQLPAQLAEADILITSTSAAEPLVRRADVETAMQVRRHRPLCIVDLGVPRNVEAAVGTLENVYLFDVDDLQGLVDHHSRARAAAVAQGQAIIDHNVEHFLAWWQEEGAPCELSVSGPAPAP